LVKLKRFISPRPRPDESSFKLPTLTVIVSAYNEEACITDKISNTLSLKYPAAYIRYIFISDGSTDQTAEIVARFPQIDLMHQPERKGKIAAMSRAMAKVTSEVVVFTDANTILNKDALLNICRHYHDPKTGAVSGEKRVHIDTVSDATAGEGLYWRYESQLKKWDSELFSVMGAAGELFSIRTNLYEAVTPDTILDDFVISMQIAEKGYRIVYEPDAYAIETSSASIREELKRKIRIAAGGLQAIFILKKAINPFHNFVLAFQYISHRVLRWTIVPFFMPIVFILNACIVSRVSNPAYLLLLSLQVIFYTMALAGWTLENRKIRIKSLFIPYYFCMMNFAVIAGIRRYLLGQQTTIWEKSKRKETIPA
jgi:poly-beta-1,6-N-acetyl-D-glucosamine synthase